MHKQCVNLKLDILDRQFNTTKVEKLQQENSQQKKTNQNPRQQNLSARKTNPIPQQQNLSARHTIKNS